MTELKRLAGLVCPKCGTDLDVQDSHIDELAIDESEVSVMLECTCETCERYRRVYCIYKPSYFAYDPQDMDDE